VAVKGKGGGEILRISVLFVGLMEGGKVKVGATLQEESRERKKKRILGHGNSVPLKETKISARQRES